MAAQQSEQATCKEIITLNIGGCGVNLGQDLILHHCAERGVTADGTLGKDAAGQTDESIKISFHEHKSSHYSARSLMLDLDPYPINRVRNTYSHYGVLNPDRLVAGRHDAATNFATAYLSGAKQVMPSVTEQLRLMAETCDCMQGFVLNHAISGGSSSGLSARVMEHIRSTFVKTSINNYCVMHNQSYPSNICGVYNTVLMMQHLIQNASSCVLLDNASLFDSRSRHDETLSVSQLYKLCNRVYSKAICGVTSPLRYNSSTLHALNQEVVLQPAMKYLYCSTPLVLKRGVQRSDVKSLVIRSSDKTQFLLRIADFDNQEDKYMAMSWMFRGDVDKQTAIQSLKWIQNNRNVSLMGRGNPSCASHFTHSMTSELPDDGHVRVASTRTVAVLANNTAVSRVLIGNVYRKYDLLYDSKAFIHHYLREGLELETFRKARSVMEWP